MTACTTTSAESGGEPARLSGRATASSGATAATRRTWWNTRTENSADDNAQSGETKMTNSSVTATQPARGAAERPRPSANARAANAAISSGSKFQRIHTSSGTAAGLQYAIIGYPRCDRAPSPYRRGPRTESHLNEQQIERLEGKAAAII